MTDVPEQAGAAIPTISAAALKRLFASTAALIVEPGLAKTATRLFASSGPDVFVITDTGEIFLPDEIVGATSEGALVAMPGVPVGLFAVAARKRAGAAVHALITFLEAQSPHHIPFVLENIGRNRAALAAASMGAMANTHAQRIERLGDVTRELAALRLDHERSLLALEKTTRVMAALGLSGASLTYAAPAGEQTVGPSGDISLSHLRQHLPVDSAGLIGADLYVRPDKEASSDVSIALSVIRLSDGKCLTTAELDLSGAREGWIFVELPVLDPLVFGECALDIAWHGDGVNLVTSSLPAVRFGVDGYGENDGAAQVSLAMKIWQGIAPLPEARGEEASCIDGDPRGATSNTAGTLPHTLFGFADQGMTKQPWQAPKLRIHKFPELVSRIEYLHGQAVHTEIFQELDFWPLMLSEDLGYMQVHPLSDRISGAVFRAGVSEGTTTIRASVRTAHDAAPMFRYVLAYMPRGCDDRIKKLNALILGGTTHYSDCTRNVDTKTGICWSSLDLTANTPGMLELSLLDQKNIAGDLILAVLPVGENISYGWCRWYSLLVETHMPSPTLEAADDAKC